MSEKIRIVDQVEEEDDGADVAAKELTEPMSRSRKEKATAHSSKPMTMQGIEYRRIRRRPTWSMILKAMIVKTKFVIAIVRDVKVGDVKPTREKIVAEKYLSSVSRTQYG